MSTYQVPPREENHEVVLGWDPPLNTFFLHVIDTTKNEDDPERDVIWIGCKPKEIHDLEVIIAAVLPYSVVSEEMWAQLYRDANA